MPVSQLRVNHSSVPELGPQAREGPVAAFGIPLRLLHDEGELLERLLHHVRPDSELHGAGLELQRREPQAHETEKKRPVQSRLVGPKRLLEDAPVIELELQMKLREREALSVELLQQIVEKLLDEEQKTLGRRLRRGKHHLAEEDLLLGLGLKGREELSGREAMEIVHLGAETFQEPLGRQAKEVRNGANVELEERLLRIGRDVEPREGNASAHVLFFFETLKGAGAAVGAGDGVGPEAGKPDGDGSVELRDPQNLSNRLRPGIERRIETLESGGIQPEEAGNAGGLDGGGETSKDLGELLDALSNRGPPHPSRAKLRRKRGGRRLP